MSLFKVLDLFGRICAASLFLGSASVHMTEWHKSLAMVINRGLPFPAAWLVAAIVVEIGGSLCLILGWRSRAAGLSLALFTALATGLFHANFTVETEAHLFFKDVALAGALLCLGLRAPGALSFDTRRTRHQTVRSEPAS